MDPSPQPEAAESLPEPPREPSPPAFPPAPPTEPPAEPPTEPPVEPPGAPDEPAESPGAHAEAAVALDATAEGARAAEATLPAEPEPVVTEALPTTTAPAEPTAPPPDAPVDAASLVVAALRGGPAADSPPADAPPSAQPAEPDTEPDTEPGAEPSTEPAAEPSAAPEPPSESEPPPQSPAPDVLNPEIVAAAAQPLPLLPQGEVTVLEGESSPTGPSAAGQTGAGAVLARVGLAGAAAGVLLLAAALSDERSTPAAAPVPQAAALLRAAPTPIGLAAAPVVLDPENAPTAAAVEQPPDSPEGGSTPTLAERAVAMAARVAADAQDADPAGTSAEDAAAEAGPRALWPFNIAIVTPTPRSEAERLLFSEPLVAREPDGAGETAPVARTNLTEQPVILPAIEAEHSGGNAVPAPSLDELVRPRILPAISVAQIPDMATPTPPAAVPVVTEEPLVLEPGRPWSTFQPAADATHFWVGRPHPSYVANQIAAPSYQFGSTGGGRYRIHHGMDIANTFGTPVRAATTGTVVHAGPDDPELLGPYNNFYGNAVVIRLDRRLAVAGGEMDVFLLYGHLSEVTVTQGQRVQPDDIVGMVGMTGIAIGPHLHVEMRVGANRYETSVNPYLWVEPPPGHGAVAVRLLTADGRTWPRARVTIARFEGSMATWARVMEIYPDNESVNPDPAYGENGAMDAVPAGVYYLVGVVNGERVAGEVTVRAGETTFVELRTTQ